jgi:hypothetical protein
MYRCDGDGSLYLYNTCNIFTCTAMIKLIGIGTGIFDISWTTVQHIDHVYYI